MENTIFSHTRVKRLTTTVGSADLGGRAGLGEVSIIDKPFTFLALSRSSSNLSLITFKYTEVRSTDVVFLYLVMCIIVLPEYLKKAQLDMETNCSSDYNNVSTDYCKKIPVLRTGTLIVTYNYNTTYLKTNTR